MIAIVISRASVCNRHTDVHTHARVDMYADTERETRKDRWTEAARRVDIQLL